MVRAPRFRAHLRSHLGRGLKVMRHRAIGRPVLVAASVLALAGLGGGIAANADDGSFAQAPVNITRPLVSGVPVEGATLTITSGEWTGTEPFTYSYTWRRCDADGFNCVLITGATDASYAIGASDIGSTIRARVTASNAAGEAGRRALPTAGVQAAPPTEGGAPRGTATPPPVDGWAHVVWVVFENKSYDAVIGSPNAPYINALAGKCGLATSFYAETHPSLPNYIAMTSGSTQGITDDLAPAAHPLDVSSIFSQLSPDGWRSLSESMPSNCYLTNSGNYAVRHNPAPYYTNIRTECANQNVPLGPTPDLSARFTFVTPNLCNDMHSCPPQKDTATEVQTGDAWLSTFLPQVLDSPEYTAGATAVFITWDEGAGVDQHIATLVIAPSTPVGTTSASRFDHYSLLRTTEEMLGLTTYLGEAANAASMRSAFGL